MSLFRSKLEAKWKASVVIWSTLELESQTISSRRSKTGNVVLVFKLNSITSSERSSEGNWFIVKKDSIKFDLQLTGSECDVVVSSAQLS